MVEGQDARRCKDYAQICALLDGKVDFIELNISCPNVRSGGMAFGIRPESIKEVTQAAKSGMKTTPLMVKLSPNVENIAKNAVAAQEGGADCISLINTLTGMAIDIERRKPIIANNTGGVSGAGIKPIAVRMVYEAYKAVTVPLVGMGGIATAEDVLEMMLAGATAVEVGAANLVNPFASRDIINDLPRVMEKYGVKSLTDIIGAAH